MDELYTFDDVLIVPKFSTIKSRSDVDLSTNKGNAPYMSLPIISSNMDTITSDVMARAMLANGAQACLHRFATIEENVTMLINSKVGGTGGYNLPLVSVGLGPIEIKRAEALRHAGAYGFIVDVAHGAQQAVVDQVKNLRATLGDNVFIVVGNFASFDSVQDFLVRCPEVDAIKVGVGPGSACTTRIKTGVGVPQLSAIQNIARKLKHTDIQVIADGGMKTPGDIAKALGAGAHMVMLGGMLSGTQESAAGQSYIQEEMKSWTKESPQFYGNPKHHSEQELRERIIVHMNAGHCTHLKYRGSASHESYQAQGKTGSHRTPEGESFLVPYKGSVLDVLADIEGGLRSAMTYVGAANLDEFRARCEFVRISPSALKENSAHGKSLA